VIPILSIVGPSGSGKTTLLEALISLLRERGYRVGTVKHAPHQKSLDQEGKDSWRHAQAGAEVAVISTPAGTGVFQARSGEMRLDEVVESYLWDLDLVLVEGYKEERFPKILVYRRESGGEPPLNRGEGLLAVVSDVPLPLEAPLFSWEQPVRVVDFVEERLLKGKRGRERVQLWVDGQRIPLNPFVQDLFHSMLRAMVSPLKGIGTFRRLSLRLDNPEGAGRGQS
jgi:molybdopterin-guanine dinucleotide biosynthesis protein B